VSQLLYPPEVIEFGFLTPSVLLLSFIIDGSVLYGVLKDLKKSKPKDVSLFSYLKSQKDPMILTVLLEDLAACTGVIFAGAGITASYITGNPIYDSIACLGVAGLLGFVSIMLVQTNKRFLIGRAVEPEIERHIREIISARPAIEAIYAVQSQYISASKFSYKAEVDFNGAYFAEQLINLGYDKEFMSTKDSADLRQLLAWYSEDVMRLVEREIDAIEDEIRQYYPEAGYIELEPNANPRDSSASIPLFVINQRRKAEDAAAIQDHNINNSNII
jgi:zinc transporter 9